MEKNSLLEKNTSSEKDEEVVYRPVQWWSLYKRDLARYKQHRPDRPSLALILVEQGLWALLQYRIASALYRSRLPRFVKAPLLALAVIWLKLIEMTTGISIPYQATIGAGFYIGHFGNIFIGEEAVIGHTCNISQGVTIGVSGYGQRRGVPRIGNRVYIAANAVVVGKITVGNDAVIAANSLVVNDVAEHTTVMGVPAQWRSSYGSEAYLHP